MLRKSLLSTALVAGALSAHGLPTAFAEEAKPAEPFNITVKGAVSLDFNTHFISWGTDVWGGGSGFGRNHTINPAATLTVDFGGKASVFVNTWWDVNTNAPTTIGGQLQEIDVNFGVSVPLGKFTLTLAYGDWMYAGDTEKVLDFTLGYDDTDFLGKFAMKPYVQLHYVVAHNISAREGGIALQFGVAPGFKAYEGKEVDVDLTFPVNITFGDSTFYTDSGFEFFSAGVSVAVPLKFIPCKNGAWSFNAGLNYYHTESAINNPQDDFITGRFGISVGF